MRSGLLCARCASQLSSFKASRSLEGSRLRGSLRQNLPVEDRRRRVDVAGRIDRLDLEGVLAGLDPDRLRGGARGERLLVELAHEARPRLVRDELELRLVLVGPLLRALADRGDRRLYVLSWRVHGR